LADVERIIMAALEKQEDAEYDGEDLPLEEVLDTELDLTGAC
jgi:hypothetical protein